MLLPLSACGLNTESVLLGKHLKLFIFLLQHSVFEFTHLLLLLFHLFAQSLERVGIRVIVVVRFFNDELAALLSLDPEAFLSEFDPHVDRAAFNGQEADVNVAVLECLGLLVARVHLDDVIFPEVTLIAVTLPRLFLFLRHKDSQILVES